MERAIRFLDNTNGRTGAKKRFVLRKVAEFNAAFSADPQRDQREADLLLAGRLYRRMARRDSAGSAIGVFDGDVRVIGSVLILSANGYPVKPSTIAGARLEAKGILTPNVEKPVTTVKGAKRPKGSEKTDLDKRILEALYGDHG